jgi:hypothetical protein
LVSLAAINFACNSTIGFDVECEWLTGDSGENRALK